VPTVLFAKELRGHIEPKPNNSLEIVSQQKTMRSVGVTSPFHQLLPGRGSPFRVVGETT
jgi:hypothetical protein